jgi:hypothetical protein
MLKVLHKLSLFFLLFTSSLTGEYVDFVSYFPLSDFPISLDLIRESGYTLREFVHQSDTSLMTAHLPGIKKILISALSENPKLFKKFPKEKIVLFIFEPSVKKQTYENLFNIIYTFDDDWVDGKKYFKIHYPCLLITNYIPKECFIDYRDFKDNEALYRFLKTMDEPTYYTYLDNIQKYLESPESEVFSSYHFNHTLLEAIER